MNVRTAQIQATRAALVTEGVSVEADRKGEALACSEDFRYFVVKHCQIYDSVSRDWIPFSLWPAQRQVLEDMDEHKLLVILKARQLGMTWLSLSWFLWNMLYRPKASCLLFSLRETEAIALLDRLTGMYDRLPGYLKAHSVEIKQKKHFGSSASPRIPVILPSSVSISSPHMASHRWQTR